MSNICFIVRSSVFLMECKLSEKFFPMNTDACNVEDINIHHITECLSLSFVASFEDWYYLFRTWSFTLCKNDLDFNDISDSAPAKESILSFSLMNLSVCCAVTTGRPVLWWRSFHELTGNWLWWIYELHQWSFHCHHDVLDEKDDECHFWYW